MSELPPWTEVVDCLKYAIAPAATATLVTMAAVCGLLSVFTKQWRNFVPVTAVLALAASLAAGNASRSVFPWVPDGKPWHWAWWGMGLVLCIEMIACIPKCPKSLAMLLRGVTAGVVATTVVPPTVQIEERWWVTMIAFGVALQWALISEVQRKSPGGWVTASVSLVAASTAMLLLHAELAGFSDMALFVLSSLLVLTVFAWWTESDTGSAAAASVMPLLSLLTLGRFLRDSQVSDNTYILSALVFSVFIVTFVPGFAWLDDKLGRGPLKIALVLPIVGFVTYRVITEAPLRFSQEW